MCFTETLIYECGHENSSWPPYKCWAMRQYENSHPLARPISRSIRELLKRECFKLSKPSKLKECCPGKCWECEKADDADDEGAGEDSEDNKASKNVSPETVPCPCSPPLPPLIAKSTVPREILGSSLTPLEFTNADPVAEARPRHQNGDKKPTIAELIQLKEQLKLDKVINLLEDVRDSVNFLVIREWGGQRGSESE